jgi:DnaJ-class molecular chaperone
MPVHTTEFYDILEVDPNASDIDIKKAFRKKAMKLHPDKHASSSPEVREDAENKFKDINLAYEVLSDPEKREMYNRFGPDSMNNNGPQRSPFHWPTQRHKPKNVSMPDLVCPITLNLRDIYEGAKIQFTVTRYVLKKGANPSKSDLTCKTCKGSGQEVVLQQFGPGMVQQSQIKCRSCKGEGLLIDEKYFDKVEKTLRKSIPRGVVSGHRIVVPDVGHEIPSCLSSNSYDSQDTDGVKKTDLILVVTEEQIYTDPELHGLEYERGVANSPFNIQVTIKIDAALAICGGVKEISFLDGSQLFIDIPQGLVFKKAHDIVIENRGMPIYGVFNDTNGDKSDYKYGDLFVKIDLSDIDIGADVSAKIYTAITGKNMKKDRARAENDSTDDVMDSIMIEDYGESDRFRTVKNDYRRFEQVYQHEQRENIKRKQERDGNGRGRNEYDSDDEDFPGTQGPGCAQQ